MANTERETRFMYKCVLLDIEGTTTPISFVRDILFSYIRINLQKFIIENWTFPELQSQIQLLRDQASEDVKNGLQFVPVIIPEVNESNVETVQEAVINNVLGQMQVDRKNAALKSFQGYMWRFGYESGSLKSVVYDDVVIALKRWKDQSIKIFIYSSGSVEAQRLLFRYSDKGDLLQYFDGHFDTNLGSKTDNHSYQKISQEVGFKPSDILFISDNIQEINAAKIAGLQTAIAERPGNAPLTADDRENNLVLSDFLQLTTGSETVRDAP
ncbi:hypothetical protein G9A89_013783 [Geosiphon pyriformis]|nr:hypothetical protein G9A89_013783 [Geosiphon pyriformis]